VSVFVVGLGGTIGLMAVMKDARTFAPGLIIGLSLLSFVAMLAVEGVLVYLLLSRRSGSKEAGEKSQLKASPVRELGIVNERALPEPSLEDLDRWLDNNLASTESWFRHPKFFIS